jgi:hypothetical protein
VLLERGGEDNEADVSGSDNNRPANNQGSSRKEKDIIKDAQELFC